MTPCAQWLPDERRYCYADGTRPYLVGARCPLHTPAALLGQPEPPSQRLAVDR